MFHVGKNVNYVTVDLQTEWFSKIRVTIFAGIKHVLPRSPVTFHLSLISK